MINLLQPGDLEGYWIYYTCMIAFRSTAESSQDVEALILDTVKSAVRFQRHVGDALIKVNLKN